MECKFHPGEETVGKCVLCYTPICNKCLDICKEMDHTSLCPKCLRAIGLSWGCALDPLDYYL